VMCRIGDGSSQCMCHAMAEPGGDFHTRASSCADMNGLVDGQ